VSVNVTVTPGITFPVESVTFPVTPEVACEKAAWANAIIAKAETMKLMSLELFVRRPKDCMDITSK
jgi:hypothetical protein